MSTFNIKGGKFKNTHLGDTVKTNQKMTIGKGARVKTASQNTAPVLTAEERGAAVEEQLVRLRALVGELAKRLSPKESKQVKHDLEELENQAKSDEPKKRWFDASAEGLMSAAKAVFEMVEPVSTAVLTIGKILFGA